MLSFIIETLFITDLWIFLYNNILALLNFGKHFKVTESFFFPLFVPEPYEIPLYLGLTFVLTIVLIFLFKFLHPKSVSTISLPLRLGLLFLLLVVFLMSLGSYPMKNDPTTAFSTPSPKGDFFFFAYIAFSLLIIIGLTAVDRIKNATRFFPLISLFLLIFLSLVTFEPRLPMSGHDYSFFLGPIWETAHGKTIYTEIPSQYGFLTILFFTLLSKLHLLTLSNFAFFVWILYPIQYYLIFYFVYKAGSSYILGGLAMLSVITLNFFSLAFTPIELPQGGPLRQIMPLLILFFLERYQKIDSKKFLFLLVFLSLFIVDMGIYITLGIGFCLFLLFFLEKEGRKKLLFAGLFIGISYITLLSIINILHIIAGQKSIDYVLMLTKIQQYGKAGYAMLPIDIKTHFWILLLSFFTTIVYLLKRDRLEHRHKFLLLTACFSFFGGIYYVGRSHPHNLFAVGVLVVLNLFLFFALFFKHLSSQKKILFAGLLFFLFIGIPAWQRKDALTSILENRLKRYTSGKIFYPMVDEYMDTNYAKEKKMIENEMKEKKILVIQADETYLFYLTNKENLLNTNPQAFIISRSDLDFAVKEAEKSCPKKAVLDCRLVKRCDEFNSQMFADPRLFVQPIILDRIESTCGFKYEPTKCTDKLCITEAKK